MQSNLYRRLLPVALASVLALASASASRADQTYHINFNTSSLAALATPPGPFSLDFYLIDGGNLSNNTATLTNFDFGAGGSAPADDFGISTNGTASGGLASGTISLGDDAAFNELYEQFTPGSHLSFDVTLTTNTDPSPDEFTFGILDGSLTTVPTLDPSLANTLAVVDISDTPSVFSYATDPNATLSDNATTLAIAAPAVTNPVPEASSVASLGLLLAGLGIVALRRTRRA